MRGAADRVADQGLRGVSGGEGNVSVAENPTDTAWQIHDALLDWTAKADAKASFALTVESLALVAILAFSDGGGASARVEAWWGRGLLWSGIALLAASALFAVATVSPNVRKRSLPAEWRNNFVYFGHLQQWDPDALAEALRTREMLPVLSRQLVTMSRIAWVKHARVRVSFLLAVAGSGCVALAVVLG
jgi:hypothetical protein